MSDLNSNNILIVSGKGHESIQDFGSKKISLSDRNIILQSIRRKNKFLSNNFKINILKEFKKVKKIPKGIKLNKACIDSKSVKKNDIFFGIKGKNNDGNKFIPQAIKKGASLVISDSQKNDFKHKKIIKVKDTLDFMSQLSSNIREIYSGKVIEELAVVEKFH